MPKSAEHSEEKSNWHLFWPIYAAAIILMSLGCVAGDQNAVVGELGVCGASTEQWSEGRGQTGFLGFYHAVNAYDLTVDSAYYDFDPFLLEGAFGSYYVSHWETGEPARIVEVSTSDPEVIAIDAVYESSFDVEAIGVGAAEIRVETDAGVADRIELIVGDLASVDFEHCCTTSQRAYYLTNSEIEIPVTYYDSYGDTPIGFGRFPFDVSDEGNLTWLDDVADPTDLHLVTGNQPTSVTLTPRVAGDPLTVELIRPSEVDGISTHWEPDPYASGLWFVGGVLHRNRTPICAGKYPMRVETLSPEICALVSPSNSLRNRMEIFADETALVEERRSGTCRMLVQLLDEDGRVVLEKETVQDFGHQGSSRSD